MEATPADPGDRDLAAASWSGLGSRCPAPTERRSPAGRREELADIVRALDSEGVRLANLELHAPTLNDVFLKQTGRSLEGAGDGATEEQDTGEHARQPVAA